MVLGIVEIVRAAVSHNHAMRGTHAILDRRALLNEIRVYHKPSCSSCSLLSARLALTQLSR